MLRPRLRPEEVAPSGSYFLVAATFRLRFRVDITLEADTQAPAAGPSATLCFSQIIDNLLLISIP
jgi:hypothetical protein